MIRVPIRISTGDSQAMGAAHRAASSIGHGAAAYHRADTEVHPRKTPIRRHCVHREGGIGVTGRLYAIGPAVHPLVRLYRSLSHRRQWQLLLMLVVMLVGAAAELVTIGAVLPFLAFLTRGGRAAMPGVAARWLAAIGVDGIFSA